MAEGQEEFSRPQAARPRLRPALEFDSSAAAGPSVRCRAVASGEEWLDAEAAARYLDFHVNTIYQMVRDGRLPALRFPVRIRREDLDTCVERCRIKPGELRHLNAYASGGHLSGEPPITQRGTPDRRFGPRIGSTSPSDMSRLSTRTSGPDTASDQHLSA
jgi:excisionase family DNA binding protein